VTRILAAFFFGLLAVFAFHGDGEAHPGHIIYCGGFIADDALPGSNYTWTADISCDNGAGDVVSLGVWRERAQFSTQNPIGWQIDPIYPVLTALELGVSSLTRAQTIYVWPYFGINCRRVRSISAVNHGNTVFWLDQSGGECF